MLNSKRILLKYMENIGVGLLALLVEPFLSFLIPVQGFIAFAIFSVMFDTVTGIMAAKRQGQVITSKGIWRTIEKIVVSCGAILLIHHFEITFVPGINLTFAVAMIIAAAELKSNMENVEKILNVSIWKFIKNKFSENEDQQSRDSSN